MTVKKGNGHAEPPPLDIVEADYDELAREVKPRVSEWDRVHRIMSRMFETLQSIQKTQTAQCEIAKESCARLTIIESKIK